MNALTIMVCVNGFNMINLSYQLNTEGNQRNANSRDCRALNDTSIQVRLTSYLVQILYHREEVSINKKIV